jgi:hypothetical protein
MEQTDKADERKESATLHSRQLSVATERPGRWTQMTYSAPTGERTALPTRASSIQCLRDIGRLADVGPTNPWLEATIKGVGRGRCVTG